MEDLNTYSYDEAFGESLKYFDGDELAARVWVNKYAMKDSFGHIYEKSPEDMHWRIANEIARIENKYKNPMTAQEVFDVSGAGDTVIATLATMLGNGKSVSEAVQIANRAAGIVVGKLGTATVTREELFPA